MPSPSVDASEIAVIRARLAASPRPADLAARRARVDALGAGYGLPDDVAVQPAKLRDVPAEWTATPAADRDRVILFLHGGGYVSGSLESHRHAVAQAGREAGTRTLALAYRLAPEHPFPTALGDALAGYRFLLESGFAPGRIALAGESAGGGLALAVALTLRARGLPLPACLWLSSPWTDLALTGVSLDTKAAVDPLLSRVYLAELAAAYLNGADPGDPLVSPIRADLAGLPPMLIQVGSAETLLDDALRLAGVAAAADVAVELQVWPHMIHAWHLFYPEVAAGRRSLASAGRYIRTHLDGAAGG
ncbi:alpha/beta hydrolase [Methylobacterium sp.]|uniref:alpha/beta hydrolase n=1 Tax=Methylobacterium sp. TaxID=409 RepID=UPI003B006E18